MFAKRFIRFFPVVATILLTFVVAYNVPNTKATIDVSTTRVQYNCDGVVTSFAYPFKIYLDEDLLVIKDSGVSETELILNTHYTVTGAGDAGGGDVELVSADTCASGYTLTILRETDLLQDTDYEDGDTPSAATMERPLDKLMMIAQMLNERLGRSLHIKASSQLSDEDLEVPVAAGQVIGWNAAGTAITTYTQGSGGGGGGGSSNEYTVNPLDYGDGTCLGSNIALAIVAKPNTTIELEPCDWVLDANLEIPTTTTLKFNQGARIQTGSYTLTVNGYVDAGVYQIFYIDAGSVPTGFGKNSFGYFRWFGSLEDNDTDDTVANQYALDSGIKEVRFTGMSVHTFNTVSDGQIVRGKGPFSGTGLRAKDGIDYYVPGVGPTGSYGLSVKSGISWAGIYDLEYDGNCTASDEYAKGFSELWQGGGLPPVKGRIKGSNIAISPLNRTEEEFADPVAVHIARVYSHDSCRNNIVVMPAIRSDETGDEEYDGPEGGTAALIEDVWLKNAFVDHNLYMENGKYHQVSNVFIEGFAYRGNIISSGGNWSNIVVNINAHNPAFDTINDWDFETEFVWQDRNTSTSGFSELVSLPTQGSTVNSMFVYGDICGGLYHDDGVSSLDNDYIGDNESERAIFDLLTNGTSVKGLKVDFDNDSSECRIALFKTGTANVVVRGNSISDVTALEAPNHAIIWQQAEGGNTDRNTLDNRVTDVLLRYKDHDPQPSNALGDRACFQFYGNSVTNFAARNITILVSDTSEGERGCPNIADFSNDNAITGALFENIRAPYTDNATDAFTFAGNGVSPAYSKIRLKDVTTNNRSLTLDTAGTYRNWLTLDNVIFYDDENYDQEFHIDALADNDTTLKVFTGHGMGFGDSRLYRIFAVGSGDLAAGNTRVAAFDWSRLVTRLSSGMEIQVLGNDSFRRTGAEDWTVIVGNDSNAPTISVFSDDNDSRWTINVRQHSLRNPFP